MAEEKKPESKKIIDVAHPGKTPPSGNSKSVIVGHGPMMKDPMVVDTDEKIEPPAEDLSKRTSKSVIKPISDEVKSESKKEKKEKPEPKSKSKSKHKLKDDDDKKTIAALAAEVDAEDLDDEPEKSDDDKPGVSTLPPAELPVIDVDEDEAKPDPEPEKAEEIDKKEGQPELQKPDADVDKSEKDNKADKTKNQETNPNETELLDDEAEKHQKEIQKLAESKQFYLPINTVEKRRSKRVVIFGVLLSLILIVAWIDIALDAGLIELGGIQPLTSFFSN